MSQISQVFVPDTSLAAPVLSRSALKRQQQAQADLVRARYITALVAAATGVPAHEIAAGTRDNAQASRARHMAMYLAYVVCSWSLSRVGQAFGRHRTTAGYACRLVEDLRDDRAFDAGLNALEACLQNPPRPETANLKTANLKTGSLKMA